MVAEDEEDREAEALGERVEIRGEARREARVAAQEDALGRESEHLPGQRVDLIG